MSFVKTWFQESEYFGSGVAMSSHKLIIPAFSAMGLVLLLVWMQGGFHSKVPVGTTAPGPQKIELKKVKAEVRSLFGDATVSGSVVSNESAQISAKIAGNVAELNVEVGARVNKGDVLAKLESSELVEREAQARAALENAKSDLVKAGNDFERSKSLFEKESITKSEYDEALARNEMAQAAETKAQATLDEARTLLSYTFVTAPFDGIIAERNVNVGDLVVAGKQLFSVYAPASLDMVASVDEQYIPFIPVGAAVTVAIPSINVTEKSQIAEIIPQKDEKTGAVTVRVRLEDRPGLAPGLDGSMTFITEKTDLVVVPMAAVNVAGQLENIRVMDGGSVKTRHVKVGKKLDDGTVEILSGLNAGEEVVIE